MGFFRKVFKSKKNQKLDVTEAVRLSIELMGNQFADLENEELYNQLINHNIEEKEALEILLFLPTVFTYQLLPDVSWSKVYYDYYSEIKQIERKYSDHPQFEIMKIETQKYWVTNPDNDVILNIASRSSEFVAIHKALENGSDLKDLIPSPTYVMRS